MLLGFSCANPAGRLRVILDARRLNAHILLPPGLRLLSSEDSGQIEVALPEKVEVESETGRKLLNEFAIVIATWDVGDCFHHFRMPRSLGVSFCRKPVSAHVLNDGRNA